MQGQGQRQLLYLIVAPVCAALIEAVAGAAAASASDRDDETACEELMKMVVLAFSLSQRQPQQLQQTLLQTFLPVLADVAADADEFVSFKRVRHAAAELLVHMARAAAVPFKTSVAALDQRRKASLEKTMRSAMARSAVQQQQQQQQQQKQSKGAVAAVGKTKGRRIDLSRYG